MTVTKVILPDYDGPLSNYRVVLATGDIKAFDPVAVGIFDAICNHSGAKLVSTSTRAPVDNLISKTQAKRYFHEAGLNLKNLHDDWSCRYDNGPRKGHIEKWLAAHPEVTHYAVVDDIFIDIPNLILVNRYDGMTFNDARKIIRALDLDEQAIFAAIARNNNGRKDPAYRVKQIKLPPFQM